MKIISFFATILLLLAFIPITAYAENDVISYTQKGEILSTKEKYEMYYRSDEIEKIINNTLNKDNIQQLLTTTKANINDYPEFKYIEISDFKYDLDNYFVSPDLAVNQYSNNNNQYYHKIIIPIYANDKLVDNIMIYYDLDNKKYNLKNHIIYRVYREDAENASIFNFVNPKEKLEKLVKDKLGEDAKIQKQYLILGEPCPNYQGRQEDNVYVETNKGVCIFVSISCTHSLSVDIINNTLYTLDEYNSNIKPKLYPTSVQTSNEYLLDKKFLGVRGGYVYIPSVLILVTTGVVLMLSRKRKSKTLI